MIKIKAKHVRPDVLTRMMAAAAPKHTTGHDQVVPVAGVATPAIATPPVDEWHTYDEVAQVLKVRKDTVYGYVRKGQIPSPTYFRSTARFSGEAWAKVVTVGVSDPGTYPVAESPRAAVGQLGAAAKVKTKRRPKATGRAGGVAAHPAGGKGKGRAKR